MKGLEWTKAGMLHHWFQPGERGTHAQQELLGGIVGVGGPVWLVSGSGAPGNRGGEDAGRTRKVIF